jgi:RHS repeat-associated protein
MKPKVARQNSITSFLGILALVFLSALTTCAQDQSQYDHGTPPQHAAGISSLGSYVSTELGTINLGNGSLNFKIPVGEVGGRGFWLPLTLNYSSKIWSADTGTDIVTDPTYRTFPAGYAVYDDPAHAGDIFERVAAGWTIGVAPMLRARGTGISSHHNNTTGCTDYDLVLVKLTLVLPDKGEIELRDDSTNGAPLGAITGTNQCRDMDGWRGWRWHATDGSGTIFIADTNNGVSFGNLSGWLITSDGTRYRFDDNVAPYASSAYLGKQARASSVTDRNGNKVTISYAGNPPSVTYTDQLGRATKIEYNVNDPQTGQPLAVLVTLPGYQGQNRYYKIKTDVMNQHYRSGINPTLPVINGDQSGMETDYTWPGPRTSLFPNSWGGGAERIDNQNILSQLTLPDGRSLNFAYNEFGEVAEVQMPTGGRVQYDYIYVPTLPAGNSLNFEVNPRVGDCRPVDRAVTARRTYPDGDTSGAAESCWTYSYNATHGSSPQTTNGYTDVQARTSDNSTLLLSTRHLFMDANRFLTSLGGSGYSLWSTGVERRTETRDAVGNVMAASEQDWTQRAALNWSSYTPYPTEQIANDNRVNEERKILDDGSVVRTRTYYQANVPYNNPTEVQAFDFDGSLKRRSVTSYVDSSTLINGFDYTSDAIHLLSLPLTQTLYDGNGNQVAQSVNEYDNYANDTNHAPLQDYGTVTQHDSNYGASYLTRGNLTRTGRWLNLTNSFIYSYPRFDDLGNVVSAKDPNGNVASISFADDFGDGSNPGSGTNGTFGPTYALPTLITSPPPTPGAVQTARSQYDFSTGLLTGFRDRNNIVTQTIYNDPFDRPTQVKSALNTGVESHAAMYYAQATPIIVYGVTLTNNDVLTARDQVTLDDSVLRSWTHTDGFGRPVESWSRDPQGDDKVATIYDALGRAKQTSNPFRPSAESAVYATTAWDLAGRVISVTTPDTAVVTTSYAGNTVTVTDQAGKQRKSVTDGLGRLTQVYEAPNVSNYNYLTSYAYDTLDDLTTVTQGTQSPRTFAYDSLKRLSSAWNPESGTISYQYDENGSLLVKTDARGVSAHYSYDALSRATRRWYNGSSSLTATTNNNPALPSGVGASDEVNYAYDSTTIANGKGRLASVSSSVSSYSYSGYDALGRALGGTQAIGSHDYSITNVAYDRAGHIISMKYPSNRTVTNVFDNAGRLQSFSGNLGDGAPNERTYSSITGSNTYDAAGHLTQEQFGTTTPIYNKLNYNTRGQLVAVLASTSGDDATFDRGKIANDYGTTDNNGNLKQQTVYITSQTYWNQRYGYDSLNRLTSVGEYLNGSSEAAWQQSYNYDRWGNRLINNNSSATWGDGINNVVATVDPVSNQMYASGDTSLPMNQRQVQYDFAGNQTKDNLTSNGTRTYDAENRMISATDSSNHTSTYSYDGGGRRVKRKVSDTETWQVYGLGGELIAEYAANASASTPQKEYGYRNGQLLITADASTAPLTNFALASNGATATASSSLNANFPASSVNNGDRKGVNWGSGGGWADSSSGSFPDWVQIDFNGSKTINEVDVFTVQDNYASPSEPTEAMTFSSYGLSAYDVQYWDGSAWVTVTGGGITGNNKVWRKITFSPITTSKIRVVTDAAIDNGYSRVTEVEAWGSAVAPPINVASSANGGVASASSILNSNFPASSVNNGDRKGTNWGSGGGWADSSSGSFPDWVQIDFNGSKTINEVDVFTLQDNYASPSEPTEAMTFSTYGLSAYDVQYWDGSAWVTVPGGGITGNNKVWKKISFSAVTTSKIRVATTAAIDNGYSRVTEVEAWSVTSGGSSPAQLHWLVTDQLGTPRMIFDQSGSLAGVSRHDYLPFGEELFAGQGGRTAALGYGAGDGARQKFTQKERDIETGLDYFGARYFASPQGRFTSPDPFSIIQMRQSAPNDDKTHAAFMQFIADPRRWNRFAYAVNSPLVFTDKTGLDIMIIENGPTKGNPLGHTAIAITGRGVYSMGNAEKGDRGDNKNNILGGGVKDYLLRELPRRSTTIVIIKTTAEQNAAAAKSMEDQAASKRMLTQAGILSDNCTSRANTALSAAGIPITLEPPTPLAIPGSAGVRGIENGNSPTVLNVPQNSNLTEADRQAIQQFEPARNTSPISAPGTPGGTPVVTMPAQTRKKPEDE